MDNPRRVHSLFWPILLVGVGITWLLINLGIIQAFNIGQLLRLWPVLLIVLGIDLIFGRRFPWAGSLIGLLTVAGLITFLVLSPNVGGVPVTQTKTETFTEPVGAATSVKYYMEASSAPVTVNALAEGNELVHAVITHRSIFNFDVTGTDAKYVRLSETMDSSSWLNWDFTTDRSSWDIGLAPKIPTEIVLNGGSGSIKMDLGKVNLTALRADLGSGSSNILMPAIKLPYQVEVDSGSGSVKMDVPINAAFTLELSSGSGSINIALPAGAALQVEVFDEGSGSLHLPSAMNKVSGSTSGNSLGVWQTAGFDAAKTKIYIKIMSQGSGSIDIHD